METQFIDIFRISGRSIFYICLDFHQMELLMNVLDENKLFSYQVALIFCPELSQDILRAKKPIETLLRGLILITYDFVENENVFYFDRTLNFLENENF